MEVGVDEHFDLSRSCAHTYRQTHIHHLPIPSLDCTNFGIGVQELDTEVQRATTIEGGDERYHLPEGSHVVREGICLGLDRQTTLHICVRRTYTRA